MNIRLATIFVCTVLVGMACIASFLLFIGAVIASGSMIFAGQPFSFIPVLAIPVSFAAAVILVTIGGNLLLVLRGD